MSREHVKIVTIGGGSSYTPELIEGFILREKQLPVSDIWLVDVEVGKEKQEIIAAMARRMIKKAGVNITIHTTLNRREAMKDADFVTTQFRVGQMAARIRDERIPLSHELIGQETNGAGGDVQGPSYNPSDIGYRKRHSRVVPKCLADQLHESIGNEYGSDLSDDKLPQSCWALQCTN